jgi:hypothetical protein
VLVDPTRYDEPPPRPPVLRTFRLEAAATFDRIYDIPIRGGEGTIGIGFEFSDPLSIDAYLSVFYGAQETGLSALHVRLGTEVMARIGRFRIGGGVTSGILSLAVATGGANNNNTTFGLLAKASLDLAQWGTRRESALFLEAKFDADVVLGWDATPMMWGPTFGAGLRF